MQNSAEQFISQIVSFQYEDSISLKPFDTSLTPIVSYTYFDDFAHNSFQTYETPKATYFFQEVSFGGISIRLAPEGASTMLAFSLPTEPDAVYLIEYKSSLAEAVWKRWQEVVGNGKLQTVLKGITTEAGAWFIRLRHLAKDRTPQLKFPLRESHSPQKISGYRFGDHWLGRYCLDEGNTKNRLLHTGVDFEANSGDKVYPVARCLLKYFSESEDEGGYIVLEYEELYTITYTHVIPAKLLIKDTVVVPEDELGSIWEGNSNGGPHLHIQIRKRPYSALELSEELVGRLPENISCVTQRVDGVDRIDPAFPEFYVNPLDMIWE
jgi:murein DD-endopeptidase MepM/ murein hydrolase activator NlpD